MDVNEQEREILIEYGRLINRVAALKESLVKTNTMFSELGMHERHFVEAIIECANAKNGLLIEMNTRLREIGRLQWI